MRKRIVYHIAFWTLYILDKSYLNFDSASFDITTKAGIGLFLISLLVQTVFAGIKIPLVYALFSITDNYLSKKWTVLATIFAVVAAFALALIGCVLANHFIVYRFIYRENLGSIWESFSSPQSMGYWLFILTFVSGIAISIKLIRLSIKQKMDEQELLKKKLELELQFLKAQSNPHFLFNTLNNIYGLARKNSDKTADVVLKLSSMLRYMLYETANQSIAIENEIQIITDYIELEKLRYSSKLKVVFNHAIDNYKEQLAPLILLPFVENAFKHGAGESRFESYIDINLTLKDQQLLYEITNSKENSSDTEDPKIGLSNIKRQLELLYTQHTLSIENQPEAFIVKLYINLNDAKI